MIRIVSDGTAHGTRVLTASGEVLRNVLEVEVMPIKAFGTIQARITVAMVAVDLMAQESVTVQALQKVQP